MPKLSWMTLARGPADTSTNMGTSSQGTRRLSQALPFKGDPAFSTVVKTLVKSHNILGTRITPFDTGGVSLLEDGVSLLIDNKVCFLRLDCAVDLTVCGIILKYVDPVVEVNRRVTEDNNIHFPLVKAALVSRSPIGQITSL